VGPADSKPSGHHSAQASPTGSTRMCSRCSATSLTLASPSPRARLTLTSSTTSHTSKTTGGGTTSHSTGVSKLGLLATLCLPSPEPSSKPPILASAYRRLSQERPDVLLNQFPCENLLTVKDCLASIARRAGGPEGPPWLPRTFNLRTELPQFVSYFQQRERR
jgi:hypothetical protein